MAGEGSLEDELALNEVGERNPEPGFSDDSDVYLELVTG